MNRNLCLAAFAVGLLAVIWIAAGYVGSHPLALTMTLLIGAVYLAGAKEMWHFQRANLLLDAALKDIPQPLDNLGQWLDRIPLSLQNPVRLRIEGERVALPGPALTPYLIGLLVMLGMLGTFLGMVVTLSGVGMTLENTTDLQTIRSSLSAPIKGLGLAFGTSVAGVAASAMLGLISAICRRERQHSTLVLDGKIATVLRGFSLVHQRQETFKALQFQAQAMPEVVAKLGELMATLERQNQESNERLLAQQQRFHQEVKAAYGELAGSLDTSLKTSMTESAQVASANIKPVVEATLSGLARESEAIQNRLADTVKGQLDGIAERFQATAQTVESGWTAALAQHERNSERLAEGLGLSLAAFSDNFEQRSTALIAQWSEALTKQDSAHAQLTGNLDKSLAAFAETFDQRSGALLNHWNAALSKQDDTNAQLAENLGQSLAAFTDSFEQRSGALLDHWAAALSKQDDTNAQLAENLGRALAAFNESFEQRSLGLVDNWSAALAKHEQSSGQSAEALRESLKAFAETFEQRSAALLAQVQTDATARDEQRLVALSQSLEAMAAALRQEWQQAGERSLEQQQQICATLEKTAGDMAAQARAHAGETINEIASLMQTAAEAPRAAAEVIGQLRQEISNGIARDNSLLEERARIMETLNALLDAINHAAAEQRSAIDSLVVSSAEVLQKVSAEFTERIGSDSEKMADLAAQVSSGAVEVASLAETLSFAVQQFGDANSKLLENLERIEGSLEKSMARSDEQLAYYVAQAREIIDLSIMSQKQVVDELRGFAGQSAEVN